MRYVRNDAVYMTEIDGEIGLLHPDRGNYYMLNSTGAVVWKHIEVPHLMDELIHKLQQEFEVTYEVAIKDIQELCDRLLGEDLIKTLD